MLNRTSLALGVLLATSHLLFAQATATINGRVVDQGGAVLPGETLTVIARSPMVETTQSVLASSIRQTEVAQLPMLNRNLAAMMTLLPGAREVPITGGSAHGTSANYVSF